MKTTLLLFVSALAALAQYAPVPSSSYPALDAILNGKGTFTSGTGAPVANCTAHLDLYEDTATGSLYLCTATNTWGRLMLAGLNLSDLASASTARTNLGAEASANKDAANGYAGLTAGSLLKTAEMPALTGNCTTVAGAVATTCTETDVVIANAASTGTTLNKLAKLTGAPSTAVIAATTDTGGVIGIVTGGAGTTGSANIIRAGSAPCIFDGATTAGDYVQISGTVAGDCHDAGSTYPTSGQVLGRVLSTNGSGGTYAMTVAGAEVQASSGGSGSITDRHSYITLCQGSQSAGSAFSYAISNSPTPICDSNAVSGAIFGASQFAATGQSVQGHFTIDANFTQINLTGQFRSVSGTTGNVVWGFQTGCVAPGAIYDPTFNTKQSITVAARGTILLANTFTQNAVTVTGCSAGNELFWKLTLDAATTTSGSQDLLTVNLDVAHT